MNRQELVAQMANLHMAQEEQLRAGGNEEPLTEWKAVRNVDTNKVASIVHKSYQIIQHRDIAESFLEACDAIGLKTEIVIMDGTNKLFMDVEFPESKIDIKMGEEFVTGFRLINSYDKSTGIVILPRLVRLACSNGMVMKSNKWVPIFHYRHNQKMKESFESYMTRAIKHMVEINDRFKAVINKCMEDSVEWELCQRLIEHLFPVQKHIAGIFKNLDPSKLITRWDLYNAVTSYATHGERLKPRIEMHLQDRAERIMETPFEKLMVTVPPPKVKK